MSSDSAPNQEKGESARKATDAFRALAAELDRRSQRHAIAAEEVDDERLKASFSGKSDGYAVAANEARRRALEVSG